ncbi:MAG: hypothetical protein MZV64_59495 [Ignavibacteriales bacterium]|nr:hypothetical protein [Ignavibacteriales bacterium]
MTTTATRPTRPTPTPTTASSPVDTEQWHRHKHHATPAPKRTATSSTTIGFSIPTGAAITGHPGPFGRQSATARLALAKIYVQFSWDGGANVDDRPRHTANLSTQRSHLHAGRHRPTPGAAPGAQATSQQRQLPRACN